MCSVESLFYYKYFTCVTDEMDPRGRVVSGFDTLEEAKGHIRFQKERFPEHNAHKEWGIMILKGEKKWIPEDKMDEV